MLIKGFKPNVETEEYDNSGGVEAGIGHYYKSFFVQSFKDADVGKYKVFAKSQSVISGEETKLESDWQPTERLAIQQVYKYIENIVGLK